MNHSKPVKPEIFKFKNCQEIRDAEISPCRDFCGRKWRQIKKNEGANKKEFLSSCLEECDFTKKLAKWHSMN